MECIITGTCKGGKTDEEEKMKKKLVGYYDYTVILTYCGMLFAFCGILQVIKGAYRDAAICLMFAGICDMFDGAVASTKSRDRNEKRFGIQIDSLSDLVSFGVLPGLFVYMISDKSAVVGIISSVFVLSALIRLAYFNVQEEERQSLTSEKRESYLGIPVTNIAILLPACYLLFDRGVLRNAVCFPVLLVLMGAGFILPVEIKKPGVAGKIAIVAVGVLEAVAMIFFIGWDMM